MTEAIVKVIRLDQRVAVCHICEAECPPQYGIPIYEGLVLPNDWTGEWGGVDACHRCWEAQAQLTQPMTIHAFRAATHARIQAADVPRITQEDLATVRAIQAEADAIGAADAARRARLGLTDVEEKRDQK